MTDAISSLYAEIGFKVNEEGLTEFTSHLEELTKAIKNIKTELGSLNIPNLNLKNNVQLSNEKELENAKIKTRRRESIEDDKRRDKTNKKFLAGLSQTLALALKGINFSIGQSKISAENAKIVKDFTTLTGDAAKQLNYWSSLSAVTGANLSRTDLAQNLIATREKFNELLLGGGDASAYHFLGLKADQSPSQMLSSMMQKYSQLSSGEQRKVFLSRASNITGIDAGALSRMFGASAEKVQEAQRLSAERIGEIDLKKIDDLNTAFSKLREETDILREHFSVGFSEVFSKALKVIQDEASKKETKDRAGAYGQAFGYLTSAGVIIGKALLDVIEAPGTAIAWFQKTAEDYSTEAKRFYYMNPVGAGIISAYNSIDKMRPYDFNDNRQITINVDNPQTGVDMANNLDVSYGNTYGNMTLDGGN